jgi:ABC-type multidrug transport system ATPase subunit
MIAVEDMKFAYKKGNLFDGITVDLDEENEAIGILGHNGAGKTTLVKLLVGALRAKSGVVNNDIPQEKIFFSIGNNLLYKELTLRQNIKFRAKMLNATPDLDAIKDLGVDDFMDLSVKSYSTGMMKRAQLANGLAFNPELILLDEPTNGMDPASSALLRNLLNQKKQEGKKIVLVTHDLHMAYDTLDRFITIDHGEIVDDRKRSDFDSYESFEKQYLDRTENVNG